MRLRRLLPALLATTALWATSAHADVILDFAGLNGDAHEGVLNYYNGGTGSFGSGPGTNYGIAFSSNALACSGLPGGTCNTALIPGGPGANALFFLDGTASTMNVAAGFTTGFSFFYSAVNQPGFVSVWDGLNGTGNLLATINLALTPNSGDPGCLGTNFCPYTAIGVNFAGTAKSVDFGGAADQVAFADVTIGSATAGGGDTDVPEPASLLLVGVGLAAMAKRRGA